MPEQDMRPNTVLEAWRESGDEALGLWLSLPDPVAAEALGGLDYDYITIDMQHGVVDYPVTVAMLAAMQRSNAVPFVRVPWNEPGIIGKVLDAGAMGVIVPMVNTVDQAEQAVASCRYAPHGTRSYGPVRAARALGAGYPTSANDVIACIPMIETVQAIENLDAILAVPGIDAVYVGPADLSLTLGLAPLGDHDDASFNDALAAIVAGCERAGVIPGIHANPAIVAKRRTQGFRMITVTSDLLSVLDSASTGLMTARTPSPGSEADDSADALY